MGAAMTETTWTMRLTKTKETDRRDASGEMEEARYLATSESDEEPPAAPRPVREMAWVERMFPRYAAEPEEVAE